MEDVSLENDIEPILLQFYHAVSNRSCNHAHFLGNSTFLAFLIAIERGICELNEFTSQVAQIEKCAFLPNLEKYQSLCLNTPLLRS